MIKPATAGCRGEKGAGSYERSDTEMTVSTQHTGDMAELPVLGWCHRSRNTETPETVTYFMLVRRKQDCVLVKSATEGKQKHGKNNMDKIHPAHYWPYLTYLITLSDIITVATSRSPSFYILLKL